MTEFTVKKDYELILYRFLQRAPFYKELFPLHPGWPL